MRITGALLLGPLGVALLSSGCSAPGVDAACDVAGVRAEIDHMLGESLLSVQSLDSLECSGDWAVARATVTGDGQEARTETFIFHSVEAGWIMKTPEVVCGGEPGAATIPDALADVACATVRAQ